MAATPCPLDTITDPQQSPVTFSDTHQDATVISVLQAKLEAAEKRIADKDTVIDDLRRRLDAQRCSPIGGHPSGGSGGRGDETPAPAAS
jgi:hypothetical protein